MHVFNTYVYNADDDLYTDSNTTYVQTTIENLKQKFKAVKERKQICGVASCHAWVASQEVHLFNVVCPTLHSALRREITRFF